jgi:hypothetical protein
MSRIVVHSLCLEQIYSCGAGKARIQKWVDMKYIIYSSMVVAPHQA